jgi:hypothetical protein
MSFCDFWQSVVGCSDPPHRKKLVQTKCKYLSKKENGNPR